MNRILLVLTLLCLSGSVAYTQEKGNVQGQVLDENQKPMQGASVIVTRMNGKSKMAASSTDQTGWFRLAEVPLADSLLVEITYSGYSPFQGILYLQQKRFTMEAITLAPLAKGLDTIIVKSSPRLIIIKKDTVEYRAGSFPTPPNSYAKNLLQQIPGLTIDQDGKMIYNGNPVTKILVDGKEFFGPGGAVSINQIPANLIDKIQITGTKTKEEELLKEKASSTDKTLNIALKQGNKYFGNLQAGGGTDGRYQFSGLGTRMRGKEKISVMAGTNNINVTGLVPPEGIEIAAITPGGGITRTITSGLFYSNEFKQGGDLQASYQFDHPVTTRESLKERRQTILSDSVFNSGTLTNSMNNNTSHVVNFSLQKQSLFVQSSAEYRQFDNISHTASSTTNSQNKLLNTLASDYSSRGRTLNFSTMLGYWKQLNERGRALFTSGSLTYGDNPETDRNNYEAVYYRDNNTDSIDNTKQLIENNNRNLSLSLSIRYTEPIGRGWKLNFDHNLSQRWGKADKTTWKLDNQENKLSIDTLFTNDFGSNNLTNKSTVTIVRSGEKLNVEAGLSLQQFRQQQTDRSHDRELRQTQAALTPELAVEFQPTLRTNYGFRVGSFVRNPSLDEIQPVADNKNPLVLKVGNPALKPEVSYTGLLSAQKIFSTKTNSLIGLNVGFAPVMNRIINSNFYDSLGRQLIHYINVNGTYRTNVAIRGSIRLVNGSHVMTISLGAMGDYNHDITGLNGVLTGIDILSLTPNLYLRYSKKDKVQIGIGYNPSYRQLEYKHNEKLNQRFWIHNIIGSLDTYIFNRLKWKNNISYRYNASLPATFDRQSIFWNTNLSYLCLKNKKGEIRFTAFDILKQNRNIERTVNSNYIEDQQANNLQQYFMLGFIWHFEALASPK